MRKKLLALAILFAMIGSLNLFVAPIGALAEESEILWENDFDTGYDPESTTIQGFDTFDTVNPAGELSVPSYWDGTYQYGAGGTNYNGKVVRKVEDGNGMMSFQHSGSETTSFYVLKDMGTIPDKLKLVFQYRARVTISENTYYNLRWRDTYAPRMSGPTIQGYQRKILNFASDGSTMDFNVGEWYDFTIVYDNLTNTRKTYINGEFVGEATNANATYYRDGRAIFWLEAQDLGNNTTIDVDDIRLLKYGDFEAKLPKTTNVSRSAVEIDFSFLPDPAYMTSDHIEITRNGDTTGTPIVISSIEKSSDSRKWIVNTNEAMTLGGAYTLNINNLKDLDERTLANQSLSFMVTTVDDSILWENDFDTGYDPESTAIKGFDTFDTIASITGEEVPSNWDGTYQYIYHATEGNTYNGKVVRKVEDGNGMMSFKHSGSGASTLYVQKDMGVITGKPKLVLQYRARVAIHGNTWYNLKWRDTYAPRMSGPTIQGSQNIILKYDDGGSTMGFNVGEWYDFTVVYDNQTNTRKTYINGDFVGEATNVNATYYNDGKAVFWLEAACIAGNTTIDVDDIRLLKYESFEAKLPKITDISRTEVEIDFSFLPNSDYMTSDHIEITRNGDTTGTPIAISSIEKSSDSRKWIVKTDEAMAMGGEYTLNISNLKDVDGRTLANQALSFNVTSAVGAISVSEIKILQNASTIEQVTDYAKPLTMQGKIINLTGTSQPVLLILAAYTVDVDGRQTLENIIMENIEAADGINTYSFTSKTLDISTLADNTKEKEVKAFVWDGENTLVPLGEAKKIEMVTTQP